MNYIILILVIVFSKQLDAKADQPVTKSLIEAEILLGDNIIKAYDIIKSIIQEESILLDSSTKAKAYELLGLSYYLMNYNEKAHIYYDAASTFYLQSGDTAKAFETIITASQIAGESEYFWEAYSYLDKFFEMVDSANYKAYISIALSKYAAIHGYEQDYYKAENALKEAIDYNRENEFISNLAYNYLDLSEVYRKQLQHPQAKEVLREAEKEFSRLLDTFGLTMTYVQLADSYFDVGDLNKSREFSLKAIDLSEPKLYFKAMKHSYNTLYLIESRKGNLERALEYLEKYRMVLDGEIEENQMLQESRKRLNIERIKRSITQSKLSEFELSKANTELQMQLKEISIANQKQFIIYVSIFVILILAILLILVFMFKAKKKTDLLLEDRNRKLETANVLLNKQNETIIEQSERISDSINYVLTIQKAMLPETSTVNQIFEENFIFFLPKDNVSGDFYWFREVNGSKFASAVDCTGHGLPGTLMSMIGSTLLNEIVINDRISDPATILHELDRRLKFYLHNREHSTVRDSMDITLIKQSKDGFVKFSGARRPLYYVLNGVFYDIKGAPWSIGGKHLNCKKFTTIDLGDLSNAVIYLTSNGFADQNNKENKKYSTKKLKNLLYLVSDKSLSEQLEVIHEEFDSHKGDEKQRDDVTIIGIKVKK